MKRVLLVMISLLLITGCAFKKTNNNELVIKEQVVGNLKFNDISLTSKGSSSTFKVTVTNMGEKISPEILNIIFKNEDDTVITTLDGTFGEIDENSFISLTLTSDVDLSKAYKVEYEVK